VTVTALPANYGSMYAIRVLPTGWTSTGGHSYAVSVGGVSSGISYTVNVVDCTTIDAGQCPVQDAGTSGREGGSPPATPDAGVGSTGDAAIRADATVGGGAEGGSGSTGSNEGGTASSGDGGSTPASQSSACSCNTAGGGAGPLRLATAWLLSVAAIALRRRRRS
jgi:MYXO-CTERM domain-containing protein